MIQNEKAQINKSGNFLEKYELASWERIHPDKQYQTTLKSFKQNSPKDYKKMLSDYSKELELDKQLEYTSVIKRGKILTKNIKNSNDDNQQLQEISKLYTYLKTSGSNRQDSIKIVDNLKFDSSIDVDRYNIPITAQTAVKFFELTRGKGVKTLQ